MDPVLKWAGGKRKIAAELARLFPPRWNAGTYFEPFLGGGAVLFRMTPENAFATDLNSRLINFYKHLQKYPVDLAEDINEIAVSFNSLNEINQKNLYYELRSNLNEANGDDLKAASLFFAINKLCFNGLYRENQNGNFNVPFSGRSTLTPVIASSWASFSDQIQKYEFRAASYTEALENAVEGDFVFLDPPYVPLTQTASFTSYSANDFALKDQLQLNEVMVELTRSGVRFMMTNSETDLTKKIFDKFNFRQIPVRRSVGGSAASRGFAPELIFMNYEVNTGSILSI